MEKSRGSNLRTRTKIFAVSVVRFASELPRKQEFLVIGKQLMRCGTSVGANYRAACRAKSRADFVAKMAIVEEEADEAVYWLEIIEALTTQSSNQLTRLKSEANALVAIVVASKKTARMNGLRTNVGRS